MRGEGINRVDGLRHLPAHVRRHDRLLVKLRAFPDETRPPRRVAVVRQIDLARVAGSDQRRPLIHGAVAIDAIDRRGVARLAIELAVAVHVHFEMAIRALHPFRQMHVLQVDRLREFLRIVVRDFVVAQIEQIAFAIVLEDGAEDPAVAVIIGELRVLELRIQFRNLVEKLLVAPKTFRGRRLRIALGFDHQLVVGRVPLLLRIHEFAVRLLVPPGVTEIRIHEEIALMHVAVHALARRNRARELMHDRMAALVFRNRLVRGEAESLVAVLAPPAGVRGRTIVGVNDVAGGAAARAIIARVIVRAEEAEQRIVQPRFLQAEENRIGAIERAETALG